MDVVATVKTRLNVPQVFLSVWYAWYAEERMAACNTSESAIAS